MKGRFFSRFAGTGAVFLSIPFTGGIAEMLEHLKLSLSSAMLTLPETFFAALFSAAMEAFVEMIF